jgi:hypothetical protein
LLSLPTIANKIEEIQGREGEGEGGVIYLLTEIESQIANGVITFHEVIVPDTDVESCAKRTVRNPPLLVPHRIERAEHGPSPSLHTSVLFSVPLFSFSLLFLLLYTTVRSDRLV